MNKFARAIKTHKSETVVFPTRLMVFGTLFSNFFAKKDSLLVPVIAKRKLGIAASKALPSAI